MSLNFEKIFKGTEDFPVGMFSQTRYLEQLHNHLEFELFYLTDGTATVTIEDKQYKAVKNDVFFIAPGTAHCVTEQGAGFKYYAMVFDESIIGPEKESTRKLFDSILINQRIKLSEELLNSIIKTTDSFQNNDFGKEIASKNLIYQILLYLINTNQYAPLPELCASNCEKKSIASGISYIRSHYRENITLEDMLTFTNYSKSHFIRTFKAATGMNYSDYLNRFRVEKACHDLIFSTKNITQIATENGFNNIQYFSKIFKKYMECTPKQYQKQWHLSK